MQKYTIRLLLFEWLTRGDVAFKFSSLRLKLLPLSTFVHSYAVLSLSESAWTDPS